MGSRRVRIAGAVLLLVWEVLRRGVWALREGGIVGICLREDHPFSTLDNDRGPDRDEGIKSEDTERVALKDPVGRKEPLANRVGGNKTTTSIVIKGGQRFQDL